MVAGLSAIEDAKALFGQRAATNAIGVKYGCVRGEARPDGGNRIVLGPVDHACDRSPVRFIVQACGMRFVAGDDEPVEPAAPQVTDIGIAAAQVMLSGFAAWHIRQRKEP